MALRHCKSNWNQNHEGLCREGDHHQSFLLFANGRLSQHDTRQTDLDTQHNYHRCCSIMLFPTAFVVFYLVLDVLGGLRPKHWWLNVDPGMLAIPLFICILGPEQLPFGDDIDYPSDSYSKSFGMVYGSVRLWVSHIELLCSCRLLPHKDPEKLGENEKHPPSSSFVVNVKGV